ncbi:MAG TPA: hypothetical protein VLW52_06520, partial [Opitutaceae bacterium]|nr:hypothetical protein [Opitutaceae bacterium]
MIFTLIPVLALLSNYNRENCLINVGTEGLNSQGLQSGEGKPFTARIVARIQRSYRLTPRYDRLRKAGMLTVEEMAQALGIHPQRVKIWNRHGLIRGHAYNGKNDCLYEHPGENPPRKAQGV